jgi:hypothetical protein
MSMSHSDAGKAMRRTGGLVLLLAAMLLGNAGAVQDDSHQQAESRQAIPVHLPDLDHFNLTPSGVVKVYDSTFNALAAKLEPLNFNGHYTYQICHWFPWGTSCATICESNWSARVTQLHFGITAAAVHISGHVDANWCGASFSAPLDTTANATYSLSDSAILITVNATSIQPRFHIMGYDVSLPVHMNVAPALTLPPIPVTTALFRFETAEGPQELRLTPLGISLTNRDGYIELQAHVAVW